MNHETNLWLDNVLSYPNEYVGVSVRNRKLPSRVHMRYPQRPSGVTDKTIRAALKVARKRISNGKCNLICLALSHAHHQPTIDYLCEYITCKIDGYGTYGSWYRYERNDGVALTYAELKEYRLAWIDWMLEGLK